MIDKLQVCDIMVLAPRTTSIDRVQHAAKSGAQSGRRLSIIACCDHLAAELCILNTPLELEAGVEASARHRTYRLAFWGSASSFCGASSSWRATSSATPAACGLPDTTDKLCSALVQRPACERAAWSEMFIVGTND